MKLPTEIFGEVIVVHTPQQLGQDQAEPLMEYLTTLERVNVVVDLDNAESIDSMGLETLLDAQDRLREFGGDLRVSTENHINRKIMEITRLDRHMDVFDNVIDAVKSYA
ncbi:MAG: STAS domain-containing protein [Planctomycetes bacterium]|nr:STAS domain-containing protein [Planctomycetota bacterium]